MTDFNMLNILKNFKSVDKPLTESTITECGSMPAAPSTPVTVNLSAGSASEMATILRALSSIDTGTSMPMAMPAPTDVGMSKLKSLVSNSSMDADEAYSDVIKDEENLDEGMDPKAVMGQIRKMAKGVETSRDEKEHQMFASQVESDLIDLFQYYNQVQRDSEKQEIVRNLIRQNKKAQQQTDLRNANNIVSVLWDLMNANEEFVNEPDEEYQDHQYMTKALSGGINRQKQMYAKSQDGDNAMAVESETIKKTLMAALQEKKQIDRNGDGKNDWEDVKLARKAAAAKAAKKKAPVKEVSDQERLSARKVQRDAQTARHGTERKPGESMAAYLARADKLKKKKAPVKEVSSKTRQAYNKAAQAGLVNAQASGDKKTFQKRDRGLDLAYDAKIRDMKKRRLANVDEASPAFNPKYIQHLQIQFGDKKVLDRSDKYKIADIIKKSSIENLKQLVAANIPHVSNAAKNYIRNNTPGGMIKYKEAGFQAPTHELDDTARKAMNIAQKIKRKINSGEQMDDRDYNQMAELGAVLSRFGTNFGPKSMKDVMAHMVQYTDDRNQEGHGYPEFNVERFKELMAMAR